MDIVLGVVFTAIAYCIGSLNWALVVSKLVFKEDIREKGSKNPGGSNVAREYGLKWGIIVIVLDALKSVAAMALSMCFVPSAVSYAGLAACVGHCFPLYFDFKGGKAIASGFGFLLGLSIFTESDIIFTFIYPLLVFLAILGLFRYVAVASMSSLIVATVIAFITNDSRLIAIELLILTLLVIYRHKTNIYRLIKGKESKVSFLA